MKPIPCNRFWFCLVVIVPALWAFLALHMPAHAQKVREGNVMDRREYQKYQRTRQAMFEVSKPYIQMQVDIMNRSSFTITCKAGEIGETHYPPDTEALLTEIRAMCDEAMRMAARCVNGDHQGKGLNGKELLTP